MLAAPNLWFCRDFKESVCQIFLNMALTSDTWAVFPSNTVKSLDFCTIPIFWYPSTGAPKQRDGDVWFGHNPMTEGE